MTVDSDTRTPDTRTWSGAPTRRTSRVVVLLAVVVAAVALGLVLWLIGRGAGDDPSSPGLDAPGASDAPSEPGGSPVVPGASPDGSSNESPGGAPGDSPGETTGESPDGAPGESPGGATVDPNEPLTEPSLRDPVDPIDPEPLLPVTADEPADLGNGVIVTMTALEQVEVEFAGPGSTAGPAVAVHLEVRNETDAVLRLDGVSVVAADRDGIPLALSLAPPADALVGELAVGEASSGIYVFRIDGDPAGLTVEVHHDTSPRSVLIHAA